MAKDFKCNECGEEFKTIVREEPFCPACCSHNVRRVWCIAFNIGKHGWKNGFGGGK